VHTDAIPIEILDEARHLQNNLHAVKEVLQKESGRRLCFINSRCTSMELFQLQVAPLLVLKFGIHQEQAGRKRVRRGE
jgi:hypothetical protein